MYWRHNSTVKRKNDALHANLRHRSTWPLKMRPTSLGPGVYKENVDYGVFCGE